ncbi:MAG: PorV/PorQ family protein, partial [Elusimicrobia bacterium]|nr:PorV/PorQ family protein [Elusimicrobiota bacterium]
MRKALPLLALAILSSGNALAASPSVGTAAVPFLLLPAGAREVALGGTGVAASEDANAMLWNPGLMAKNRHNSATFMHSAYLENSMYDFAAVNWKLDDRQALGVSAQYFSAGKINSTDDAGQDIGTIRPYDIAVSAGYSRIIGGWGLGVSGKAIQSKIINTAKTFAMDLGVSPPELLDGRLRLGAAYTNLGAKIRYNSVDEKLPAAIRLGAGYKLTQGLTLSSDIALPNAGKNYITLGAEMGLPVGGDMGAALRAGYSTQ